MSYGQYIWQAKKTWILHKDSGRARNVVPKQNYMQAMKTTLLDILLTVAHTRHPWTVLCSAPLAAQLHSAVHAGRFGLLVCLQLWRGPADASCPLRLRSRLYKHVCFYAHASTRM